LLIALPLCQPGARLIEQLRAAGSDGRNALILTILDDQVTVSSIHVPEAPHLA
jgi:hypothetical protein